MSARSSDFGAHSTRGFAQARRAWSEGASCGFPRCCLAHYCWDALIGRVPGVVRWNQVEFGEAPFVPCGLLHAPGSPFGVFKRGRRIAAWAFTRHDTKRKWSRGGGASYADVRWWREWAAANEFSYGDRRGPLCPGAGLDRDLEWI